MIKYDVDLIDLLKQRYPLVPDAYWSTVNPKVHDQDDMFSRNDPPHWAAAHYLGAGREVVRIIETALKAVGKTNHDVKTLLDLPCGYGRVMRHLRLAFPEATLTGSEIFQSCLDFCGQQFGAQTFLSNPDFVIANPKQYDLIWCGSLFTHLSASKYRALFQFFDSQLAEGDLLLFTVHGRYVRQRLEQHSYDLSRSGMLIAKWGYDLGGYGYADYNKNMKGYGISVMKPAWFMSELSKHKNFALISYQERGWDNHQDVVVVQKRADLLSV